MEKANVVPVNNKNRKPISLLPITGKVFERLFYDRTFEFFTENNLISKNQSCFRPGDSCIKSTPHFHS